MKVSNLKSTLSKMNICYYDQSYNSLNKAIIFEIKGITVEASYDNGKENIDSFSIVIGNDERCQEKERIFFYSFKKLMKYFDKNA